MQLIRARDMKVMPWKNGGGVTTEIAMTPPGASLAELSFDWRISRAEIRSDGPFSKFPGYDRRLVLLGPDALLLNGEPRSVLKPFFFSGDDAVEARLVGAAGFTFDLGVIFRRGVDCEMQVLTVPAGEHRAFTGDETLTDVCLYLAAGSDVSVSGSGSGSGFGETICAGDALRLGKSDLKSGALNLTSLGPEVACLVAIFLRST